MSSEQVIAVKPEVAEKAWVNSRRYQEMYQQSLNDPDQFWAQQAERLQWDQKWNQVKKVSFRSPVEIKWYLGGKLNVSVNCIDRHLTKNAQKTAIIWEADSPIEAFTQNFLSRIA